MARWKLTAALSLIAPVFFTSAQARCAAERSNGIACDLLPLEANGGQPMSVVVPNGKFLKLTNNTGSALQVSEISATTGEKGSWSEYCAGLDNVDAPPHQPLDRRPRTPTP